MGLFDVLERLNATEEQQPSHETQPQQHPIAPSNMATAEGTQHPAAKESSPDTWEATPTEIEERRRTLNRKPERLSFLAPCPVCHGRAFLHIDGGGFVCKACHPGLFGYPVEATGTDRADLLPDVDLLPAGETEQAPAAPHQASHQPTEEQRANFAAAWPWIKENKAALLAAGWTMAALTRRAKFRWPVGPWGVAWMPVWNRPGVEIAIGQKGEILFTYQSNGRDIKNTTWPP